MTSCKRGFRNAFLVVPTCTMCTTVAESNSNATTLSSFNSRLNFILSLKAHNSTHMALADLILQQNPLTKPQTELPKSFLWELLIFILYHPTKGGAWEICVKHAFLWLDTSHRRWILLRLNESSLLQNVRKQVVPQASWFIEDKIIHVLP